jgi:serine-type D-Ala-D-Ala carboxypeptidase
VTGRARAIDGVLDAACGTRFTGAVARVERFGKVVYEQAFGTTGVDGVPVYVDTRFDLASLTKLFAATLALRAVDAGLLSLDESLLTWIPEWRGTAHAAITLRMLLAHDSGMDSGADYRTLLGKDVAHFALVQTMLAAPRERVIYSDLGFIVLGVLLERVHGRALPALVRDAFGEDPAYRPRERASIPATEADAWRGRVQGSVHDEKAHLLGGVAGHAGLFGTALSVAKMTQLYLDGFHADAVAEQAFDPVLRRGLGWALKTTDENSCGARFSMRSFGHTGFTGTCVWADPERGLQAVLLTNSVYFGREDTRLLRIAFYDAVIDEYGA